ncbi:MAG: hypothetical protein KME35_04875 [Aphanocapsa sp. GSE-SYN-MK-11-07L]|jgi:uncharacterized SAM-dependent methyltransferase|nr:hypothetical protein [Aphanocapsa sp. GSE-SYN-MK-11-07L]
MLNGIRQKVIVQTGGVVELQSPDLPEGAIVEVIVLLEPEIEQSRTLTSFIGAAKGSFLTPEEVDQFIRQERDTWDS